MKDRWVVSQHRCLAGGEGSEVFQVCLVRAEVPVSSLVLVSLDISQVDDVK